MSRSRSGPLAVLALVVLAVSAACGSAATTASGPAAPANSSASAPVEQQATTNPAAQRVPKKLRFTARTVGDEAFDGASLAGQDAVFWFWAPWCTECRREAPHVAAVQAATQGEVTFVGVAGLGETAAMRAFVSDYKVGAFTHVADLDGELWKRFGVVQQPAYAFVDDSGKVKVLRGELGEERLAAEVSELTAN